MKKFTVLVALALLAATGTSYAVTCAYDNVPGATLLVPHFKVGMPAGQVVGDDIPAGNIDTMVAITNVSEWGVVAHVTVWNKQSVAVLDFNIPMTGYDVATFRMRDILNGKLNVNKNVMHPVLNANGSIRYEDPCDDPATIGTDQTDFQRFENPSDQDAEDTLGYYDEPAFIGLFRTRVWTSLDEGYDYSALVDAPADDVYNPACVDFTGSAALAGDFTGYLTIDVTNYCTNYFPDQEEFYTNDAIATLGWGGNGVGPNVLMGDVFYIDANAEGGNISGEAAVSLEFDSRLDWETERTFYNRFTRDSRSGGPIVDAGVALGWPDQYAFIGDGREPLGTDYGFRFINLAPAAQSFLTVWRSDLWNLNTYNLCHYGSGSTYRDFVDFNDEPVEIFTWDEDEDYNIVQGGGPSGNEEPDVYPYVWWETQRIILGGNLDANPGNFEFGWSTISFPSNVDDLFNQAYVGISHTAAGDFVSVGHGATLLDNQFTCDDAAITETGNLPY